MGRHSKYESVFNTGNIYYHPCRPFPSEKHPIPRPYPSDPYPSDPYPSDPYPIPRPHPMPRPYQGGLNPWPNPYDPYPVGNFYGGYAPINWGRFG